MLETFPIPSISTLQRYELFLSPPKIFTYEQQIKPVKNPPPTPDYLSENWNDFRGHLKPNKVYFMGGRIPYNTNIK